MAISAAFSDLVPANDLATPLVSAPKAREHLEALLRERQLDRTLTTALPDRLGADAVVPFGLTELDDRLAGGVPRGQVSEIVGPSSSGRTSLAWTWLGTATARGESVALVDTFDRFDPATGALCGIELSRLLWVRGQAVTKTAGAVDPAWLPGARTVDGPGTLLERTIDRALKALTLVLHSGVCTAVMFDIADVPLVGLRRIPHTTWLRLQHIVEGSETTCLLVGSVPMSRSARGITIATGATGAAGASGVSEAAVWAGGHDRARRLAGLAVVTRVSSARRVVRGMTRFETRMRGECERWAVGE
ncbi:MAG: hypothetical protein ACT4QD_12450 [Acidobacteriota bacterium]